MKSTFPPLPLALLLVLGILCSYGCSRSVSPPHPVDLESSEEEATAAEVELSDSACSYFYFLWGTHAENNRQFQEAEEAYEKALICDPDSPHILRRLPILLIRMDKPQKAAQRLRMNIERFPDELQDRLLLARLDARHGEIDEAIKLYKEIIQLSPGDETSLLRLGLLYSQQNLVEEARNMFSQTLDLNPDSFFGHLYLARLATQSGEMEEAGKWYDKTLELNWSMDLALEIADFYGSQKDYRKVEELYREIIKRHPDDRQAALGLVHTLLLQQRDDEALKELKSLRKDSSNPEQVDIIIARLYLRTGRADKAAEILTPLAASGDEPEAAYMLAILHYQKQETGRAMTLLETISRESPFYEDSLYLRVRILLDQKRTEEAVALLSEGMDVGAVNDPDLYSLLASLYMELKRTEDAYRTLDKGLQEYPDNPTLHFEYGLLLEEDSRQEEAIAHMKKVLDLEPEHAEALNYIGYTWADQNINLEQALEFIERALILKPGSGYIQDSLGWVYFRMGQPDRARREILKALDLTPADPHIYDHLGDIYRAQEETEKARKAYEKAKELFSDQAGKARMRKKLNELR